MFYALTKGHSELTPLRLGFRSGLRARDYESHQSISAWASHQTKFGLFPLGKF